MRRLIALAALALCFGAAQERRKPRKKNDKSPPEVALELKIQRDGDKIVLDGKVRNIAIKPLEGVVLFFEFLEPGGKMISRMNTEASEHKLDPGDEGEFQTQTPDQVRAVSVRLDAEDKKGRYLRLDKAGPFTIE